MHQGTDAFATVFNYLLDVYLRHSVELTFPYRRTNQYGGNYDLMQNICEGCN